MDVIQLVNDVLSDPANQVSFAIAALIFFGIALLLGVTGRRQKITAKNHGVAIRGDSHGVISTGKVSGSINTSLSAPSASSPSREPASSGFIMFLTILSAVSGVICAVFAVLTYFLPPSSA